MYRHLQQPVTPMSGNPLGGHKGPQQTTQFNPATQNMMQPKAPALPRPIMEQNDPAIDPMQALSLVSMFAGMPGGAAAGGLNAGDFAMAAGQVPFQAGGNPMVDAIQSGTSLPTTMQVPGGQPLGGLLSFFG